MRSPNDSVMSTSKHNLVANEWEMSTIERKYSVPPGGGSQSPGTPPHSQQELQPARGERGSTSEDLHAWSIYRSEKIISFYLVVDATFYFIVAPGV